jgi:hypothetical protein
VSVVSTSGYGADPTAATTFIGPTVQVTVAAGQSVYVNATKALGTTTAGGSGQLYLWVCYQTGAAAIQQVGGGILGLQTSANNRNIYAINFDIPMLPAGTYTVGMCGYATTPANWNSNEYGYLTALVHN